MAGAVGATVHVVFTSSSFLVGQAPFYPLISLAVGFVEDFLSGSLLSSLGAGIPIHGREQTLRSREHQLEALHAPPSKNFKLVHIRRGLGGSIRTSPMRRAGEEKRASNRQPPASHL